jgi:hypothetical protein
VTNLPYFHTADLHECDTPPIYTDGGRRSLLTGTRWTCSHCGRTHVVAYIDRVGTRWMTTDPFSINAEAGQ